MTDLPTPNYAARRMLFSTIGITALVALTVVGWRLVRGDNHDIASAAASWSELVLIDRTTGTINTVDENGAEVTTELGLGRVVDTYSEGGRIALVGAQQIVLSSLDGTQPIVIPIGRDATVTRLPIVGALTLVVGDEFGGNVQIVDGMTGTVLDVGALAEQADPQLYADTMRHSANGTRFAVADAQFFQTILVEPDSIAPVYYPDYPVAVDDDKIVATSQVVGQRTDIGLFDETGVNLTIAPTQIPAGGIFVDDELVFVSTEGGVFRLGTDDEQPDQIGTIIVPGGGTIRWVRPTQDGERLVVFGNTFEAVIKLDGSTVYTMTFTSPVEGSFPDPAWSCIGVGDAAGAHSLVSLDSGEVLADLAGFEVTGASSDGCTVIGERAGITEVVALDGSVRLGQVRNAVLGPDGRTVVWQTNAGRTELLRINDNLELEDPVDLSAVVPASYMVVFLDR
jgi:hypothetical protein